ncbi:MAG: hypothetical protein Fur0044_06480 [Anaerolineae bacterium]|nr:hypothetical protein [Anaerolineales bacterium]MCQ3971919.1 hypothetical protein [Anaerolineae bacterium]
MTKSLWPDEISVIKEVPPVSIFKEQASFLGGKTKNLVTAEVDTDANYGTRRFYDVFYLVAPALDHYRFELFRASRDIVNFYPIQISSGTLEMDNKEVTSEDELIKVLSDIFSHPKTIKIIQSMLVQSGWSPEEDSSKNGGIRENESPLREDEIPF